MTLTAKLTIQSRIRYDGEQWTVQGFTAGNIQLRSEKGVTSLISLDVLTGAPDFRVLDAYTDVAHTDLVTFVDNVPKKVLNEAETLLAHLNEAECGYKAGSKAGATPDEPRLDYDPQQTTLNQRLDAKSKELGISSRSLWRMKSDYLRIGIYGLIDQRHVREVKKRTDPRIIYAMRFVLAETRDKSNVTRKRIIERTKFRIHEQYPNTQIKIPSDPTLYRLLDQESKGTAAFDAAKTRRSNNNRPQETYRQQEVVRPGEFVLIDSTPLDAFALDPLTFQWIPVQLTIALDLYTRSIVGWRFTPVSTKGVDAALLLYDIIRPKLMQPGWPEAARWPYLGVPESIAIELVDETPEHGIAGIPLLHPETVVIDNGKVFISRSFKDACKRLGINIQLARPYTPTDKGQVERVFKTIRENFVERLPGYKGPDVFSRGLNPEGDAYYFLDEIEAKFACWVATEYQRKSHAGLAFTSAPLMSICPNDMYSEGIARAGFVYVIASDIMYYELLPTGWRTVQHYGVEMNGLRYNGDILGDYRNRKSPYGGMHAGKWPIRYDPRDLSRVFFFDEFSQQWHELAWLHDAGTHRPFNEATLGFAKSLLLSRGGNAQNTDELAETISSLLHRMLTPSELDRHERRLAAVNALHAQSAHRDQQSSKHVFHIEAPDQEVELVTDGPISGLRTTVQSDSAVITEPDFATLRTLDEVMEDDDDELGF